MKRKEERIWRFS